MDLMLSPLVPVMFERATAVLLFIFAVKCLTTCIGALQSMACSLMRIATALDVMCKDIRLIATSEDRDMRADGLHMEYNTYYNNSDNLKKTARENSNITSTLEAHRAAYGRCL